MSDTIDFVGRFKIKRVEPANPRGTAVITYDSEEDILWIGRRCDCTGEACIHACGDILMDEARGVIVTVNAEGRSGWFISSFALRNASRNPLWVELFRGLELALRERETIRFTLNPAGWILE